MTGDSKTTSRSAFEEGPMCDAHATRNNRDRCSQSPGFDTCDTSTDMETRMILPAELVEGTSVTGNEYGWPLHLFPDAARRAESLGYACLGGQFNSESQQPPARCTGSQPIPQSASPMRAGGHIASDRASRFWGSSQRLSLK